MVPFTWDPDKFVVKRVAERWSHFKGSTNPYMYLWTYFTMKSITGLKKPDISSLFTASSVLTFTEKLFFAFLIGAVVKNVRCKASLITTNMTIPFYYFVWCYYRVILKTLVTFKSFNSKCICCYRYILIWIIYDIKLRLSYISLNYFYTNMYCNKIRIAFFSKWRYLTSQT